MKTLQLIIAESKCSWNNPAIILVKKKPRDTVPKTLWVLRYIKKHRQEIKTAFKKGHRDWLLLNRAHTSTQLHPSSPSSFQPPTSSLQHPEHY